MNRRWLLLALLAATLPAAGTDMYAWTDAHGVRHFSDSPPPPDVAKAHRLKVEGGVTSRDAADEHEQAAAKTGGPALAAAAGYSPEDIKRNCDIANRNLTTLEAQKPALDADGDSLDTDAGKTRQAQIDKANQQIKLFCAQK